jgi:hypothetical protein
MVEKVPRKESNVSEISYRLNTFLDITEEDIQRTIKYIKSDENQDRDLQKYKDLSDEELAKIIVDRIENEVYETLRKLSIGEIAD